MLFMVLGARRKQALFTVIVDNIVTEENKMIFLQNKTSKHTNTLKPLEPLIYQRHPLKNKLCIVNVLCTVQCYLGMRENLVSGSTKEFIITYGQPYKPASSDSISRYIKEELGMAVINTNVYKPHSCWSALTSKARDNVFSITDILKRGCWKKQNTFAIFYSKDTINHEKSWEDLDYSRFVLAK